MIFRKYRRQRKNNKNGINKEWYLRDHLIKNSQQSKLMSKIKNAQYVVMRGNLLRILNARMSFVAIVGIFGLKKI